MSATSANLVESERGRRTLFAVLYFAEGAPIGFVWWALPTLLRQRGARLEDIGAHSAVLVLPWAFKFLWAPLVDICSGPRFTLRGWILASQAAMVATLVALAAAGADVAISRLRWILLLHAFAAATQDVAIDALAIRTTGEGERGSINAWMQAGMLSGRALFGGGALLLAASVGEQLTILLLAAVVAAGMLVSLVYRDVSVSARRKDLLPSFRAGLASAFARSSTWFAVLFAASGAAGFEAVGALIGPMLSDRGVGAVSIGAFLSAPAAGSIIVGGLLGGRLCRTLGTTGTVRAFGIFVALLVAALSPVADRAGGAALWAVLTALYFGIGAFTVASYAFFMDRTDPALGSTQFSAYMGATNLCEAWAARVSGALAGGRGYGFAFTCMATVSIAALPLLSLSAPRSAEETR